MTGDRKLATHEAGHAVATIVRGKKLEFCTVRPTAELAGYAQLGANLHEMDCIDVAVICLAGPLAENMLTSWSCTSWPGSASDDLKQAEKAIRLERTLRSIRARRPVSYDELWDDVETIAKCLVVVHWNSITRVADALTRRGRLSGARVRELMEETRR